MAGSDAKMRKALKRVLYPALRQIGFVGSGWDFQRQSSTLEMIAVQFGKYGGEFILEAAKCPRGDLQTSWGEVVPEAKITVAHINPLKRARLERREEREGSLFCGFVYGKFGEDNAKYVALAEEVTGLLPQLEAWLQTGEATAHVRPYFAG